VTDNFADDDALWRRCERAWAGWLQGEKWAVVHLTNAIKNVKGIMAPMVAIPGGFVRAPDLLASKAGVSQYWEVKYRSRPIVNQLTGEREHWMQRANVSDYHAVSIHTGHQVKVALYEASARSGQGEWFQIDINTLIAQGRRETKIAHDGNEIDAWVWPCSAMQSHQGPKFLLDEANEPLLPREGEGEPIPESAIRPIERNLRKRISVELSGSKNVSTSETYSTDELRRKIERILEDDNQTGLDVLCSAIRIPSTPKYSVMRIGDVGIDVDEVLGLLHYGVRVFLITPTRETEFDKIDLAAFEESRLLEWAAVPESAGLDHWIIDGQVKQIVDPKVQRAIDSADASGKINIKQYWVVHAKADSDVIVRAGAGTGKTETMSERVVFLLSTSENSGSAGESYSPYTLRMDDIVLVTFTREAARQMRERLSKTLGLRKRLSRRCVMPALAWMMQLSSTEVSTIHSYAKSLAQQGGGIIGFSNDFRVSNQTMKFREELYKELSPRLDALFNLPQASQVPAVHLWRELLETIWEKLDNNGVEVMSLGSKEPREISWPIPNNFALETQIVKVVTDVLTSLGRGFAKICSENQAIPTSKLVATAIAAITEQPHPPVRIPKYVFIDEFQDTDSEQMTLMLKIRALFGSNLFVVGDVKQGVYRFRGAQGDAFEELKGRFTGEGLTTPTVFPLTRNFRSGKKLLSSLHPFFLSWGKRGWLEYRSEDMLEADVKKYNLGGEITTLSVRRNDFENKSVAQVKKWRNSAENEESHLDIAVLCRENWTAIKVQRALIDSGVPCELVVGGDFYRAPAVRELRVLFEAVANPNDNAALLELCETRWLEGILVSSAPEGTVEADGSAWQVPTEKILSWHDRLATLSANSFSVDDIEPLRARLMSLRNLLEKMSVLSWLILCSQSFAPAGCALQQNNDEIERARYIRCFDHLLVRLDDEFAESPTTLPRMLEWLRLQIATNFNEDEPFDVDDLHGKVTALTVHKSKGLEFDCVLVPYMWGQFVKKSRKIDVVIESQKSGIPRIVWKWKHGELPSDVFQNVPDADGAWSAEIDESCKEETRLLYVALTRARRDLVVFLSDKASVRDSSQQRPNSWEELMMQKVSANG